MRIIFCTLHTESALGLQYALKDMAIVLAKRSALGDFLEKQFKDVLFLEDHEDVSEMDSTFKILSSKHTQKFIKKIADKSKPQILVFKNLPKIQKLAEKKGWNIIHNHSRMAKLFEDKINFIEECKKAAVQIPKSLCLQVKDKSYKELKKDLGNSFVLQFRRGFAGASTHFVHCEKDWKELQKIYGNYTAKLSQFIKGPTLTYNVCIGKNRVEYSKLMYQITGHKDFNDRTGGTCGVDTIYAKKFHKYESKIKKELEKFTKYLQESGFRGFIGLDFILESRSNKVFLLESNPRLTGNLPLNNQIEFLWGKAPVLAQHIKEFVPKTKIKESKKHEKILGSYFILRNQKDILVSIQDSPKAGKYKLNGDFVNSDFQLQNCKKDEYILHVEKTNVPLSTNARIATISAPFSVLDKSANPRKFLYKVKESFKLKDIYLHPKDFWKDKYALPRKSTIDVFKKPLKNFKKLNEKARTRNRQTQCLKEEGTFKLLGQYQDFYLVKKWEGTYGWAYKNDLKEASEKPLKLKSKKKASAATVQKFLKKYQNAPYLWGGLTSKGIDCSSLTQRYFLQIFGIALPKHSRDQMKHGKSIKLGNQKDHDLIFLEHKEKKQSHVGIFLNEKVLHASLNQKKVVLQELEEIKENYKILGLKRCI